MYIWGAYVQAMIISDGFLQKKRNSSALPMELRLSCIKPSKWFVTSLVWNFTIVVNWLYWKWFEDWPIIIQWAVLRYVLVLLVVTSRMIKVINGWSYRYRSRGLLSTAPRLSRVTEGFGNVLVVLTCIVANKGVIEVILCSCYLSEPIALY